MKFNTQYDYVRPHGEFNSGEVIVDPTGYLPPEYRIKKLFNAGKLLDLIRDIESKNLYDAEIGVNPDDIPIDPTRHPSFDFGDAYRHLEALSSRLSAQRESAHSNQNSSTSEGEEQKSNHDSGTSDGSRSGKKQPVLEATQSIGIDD